MSKKTMIEPSWQYYRDPTFASAVRKGNMLFVSGLDAAQTDPATGKPVVKGDIVEQTAVIYKKLQDVLEAAGASFEDVVWTTDYITTTENYRGTADIRRQYFKGNFPASSGFVVKELLRPGALVEIDAVAVLD